MQSDHGIGWRTTRVAICVGKRACSLLHSSEAAKVNYWPIFLFLEQELAWGSSPVDLHSPEGLKNTCYTLSEKGEEKQSMRQVITLSSVSDSTEVHPSTQVYPRG